MANVRFLFLSVALSLFLNAPAAKADTTSTVAAGSDSVELDPIIKDGSVSDVLMDDPVLPTFIGRARSASGSGGLEHELANEIPVSFTDTGSPGNLSQIRGFGQSSEETDVQTLGIPLNGAQGGGFDFSTFPQFLWSDFRYQMGPSLGAFDPAGVAGSLTLRPWTEAALTQEGALGAARATSFSSDAGVTQISVSGRRKDTAAALAGYSTGLVEGPSGSFSAVRSFGPHKVRFHFLGTDLDAKSRRVKEAPFDRKASTRWIPVIQTDFRLTERSSLKSTFFFDSNTLRSTTYYGRKTLILVEQIGNENAFVLDEYKFGLSARRVSYDSSDADPVYSNIFSLQGSRTFESGAFLFEPTLRLTEVSGYDIAPEATLGARYQAAESDPAYFTRLSYSRRFPTLVKRFYFLPPGPMYHGVVGNPDLKPERDFTAILGTQYKRGVFDGSLQFMSQLRLDGQVFAPLDTSFDSYFNASTATVHAAVLSVSAAPTGNLTIGNALTFSKSHVTSTDQSYPYLPDWLDVLSVSAHPESDRPSWSVTSISRLSSDSNSPLSGDDAARLPGYALFDLRFEAWVWRKDFQALILTLGAQNIFDREAEVVRDNPLIGRIYTFSLVAEL
jgi:hypothetical protein